MSAVLPKLTLLVLATLALPLRAQLPETKEEIAARDKRNRAAEKYVAKYGSLCQWDQRMEHSNIMCVASTVWDLDTGAPWKPEPEVKLAIILQLIDRYAAKHSLDLEELRSKIKQAAK